MTHMDINEDTAYVSYNLQGWIKYLAIGMSIFFIVSAIYLYAQTIILVICVLGALAFASMLTYKVETIIDRSTGNIYHRLSVLGVCRKNEFTVNTSHLLAELHKTKHVTYPILWLISSNNKKFKIGEFMGQDIDQFANNLQKFSGLQYDKAF